MRKRLAAFVAVVLLAALGTQLVAGDGSEQLGTPSIPIADGTDIVAAGTGLLDSSGTIDITIPGGATVLQVLLYWENFERDGRTHDDDLTVNGVDVVGTSIGGPTSFFATTTTQTFRADITALGAVVPGANSVAIGGAFSTASNGAGIVAIIDDGTNQVIDLRDGNDAAWIGLAPPLKDMAPVTYTFDAAASDRTATLDMFFSSVTGSFSTGILRPTSIEVESGGVTTVYSNLLDSNDGDEWDTVELSVNVPTGATSVTVQAFSRDDLGSGDTPASFVASVAALTLPVSQTVNAEIDIEKFTRIAQVGTGETCETAGKPIILTLVYTGDGDDASDHSQDADKALVEGDPNNASPVRIVATDKKNLDDNKAKIFFDGTVNLNESFVLDPANVVSDKKVKLGSNTTIFVFDLDDNLLQKVMFHTSCSQPLEPGDQFGSVLVSSWVGKEGVAAAEAPSSGIGEDADTPTGPIAEVGDTIVWTYIVTNPGDTQIADVSVVDDAGTPGDTGDDFSPDPVLDGGFNVGDTDADGRLDPGEEWVYTATGVAEAGQYGNLSTVVGTPVDDGGSTVGPDVTDEDPSHYFVPAPPVDVCESKPVLLTMVYTGDGPDATSHSQDDGKVNVVGDPEDAALVRIIALDKDELDDKKAKIWFDGTVALGESFDIDGNNGDGKKKKLGSKTFVLVLDADGNLLQHIEFHTSCSQPLSLGDQFGSVELTGFVAAS